MTERERQPIVLVIGGPNGAGKSTCADGIFGGHLRDGRANCASR